MTFIIRPANMDDVQPIYEMAKRTGGGFTNLPPDRKALTAKLEKSEAGFDRVSKMTIAKTISMSLCCSIPKPAKSAERARYSASVGSKMGRSTATGSVRSRSTASSSTARFRADILNLSTDLEGDQRSRRPCSFTPANALVGSAC